MLSSDVFYITFPPEIILPSLPTCSGIILLSAATCSSPSTGMLKVVLTFAISPSPLGNMFSFKVNGVKNAANTKTTSAFSLISASDSAGNQIAIFTGTAPTITNASPAAALGTLT